MSRISLSFCFLFSFALVQSEAQTTARVLKVKGRKAIVELDDTGLLQRGDEIIVESRSASLQQYDTGSRKNSISGSGSFASISTETERDNVPNEKVETTTFTLEGRYGWNIGVYEYGPVLSYSSSTVDSDNSSNLSLGGFFDYNFYKANKPGVQLVPTSGVQVSFLSANADSQSGSGFGFTTYIGAKYFLLTQSLAFTGYLNIDYQSVSFANNKTETSIGPRLSVGLSQYF